MDKSIFQVDPIVGKSLAIKRPHANIVDDKRDIFLEIDFKSLYPGSKMSQYKNSSLVYRPDLDGLRGLAILLVMLFHLDFEIFSGGFIGVDVFFVLSGYLITHSIVNDFSKNRFSLISFFHRRVLRILPALISFVIVVGMSSILFFQWERVHDQLKIMIYVLLFVPNLYFGQETNYSAVENGLSPYFHTWSLGVEEQFYLFWPFFLLFFYKIGKEKWQFWGTLCLVSFSLYMRQKYIDDFPLFSFHSPLTRIWEMAIGGAFVYFSKNYLRGYKNYLLSIVGILLILLTSSVLEINTKIQGIYVFLPAVGTLFCIFASDWNYSPLKFKPLVVMGRMSFSLYLIHWPIIVFFNEVNGGEMTLASQFSIFMTSFCLAFLSWRFIEMPFIGLRSEDRGTQIKTIGCGLASLAALSLIFLFGLAVA